jgi:hypothetical protein
MIDSAAPIAARAETHLGQARGIGVVQHHDAGRSECCLE